MMIMLNWNWNDGTCWWLSFTSANNERRPLPSTIQTWIVNDSVLKWWRKCTYSYGNLINKNAALPMRHTNVNKHNLKVLFLSFRLLRFHHFPLNWHLCQSVCIFRIHTNNFNAILLRDTRVSSMLIVHPSCKKDSLDSCAIRTIDFIVFVSLAHLPLQFVRTHGWLKSCCHPHESCDSILQTSFPSIQ